MFVISCKKSQVSSLHQAHVLSLECGTQWRIALASTLSIFRPGSSSPSAILYDAWERAPTAHESIRSIRPDLATAVDECIDAAGREWEPYWQKRLLNVRKGVLSYLKCSSYNFTQAAKFGRGYLDFYNPEEFVNMGQTLKVLNAVRSWEIGIAMTFAQ
jgi:vacuolar protein sorting-associated protein 16